MAYFLLKTEPDEYSLSSLAKEGETIWNGVKNPLAQKHLRSIKVGDKCFIYHTGSEKQIVGLGEALTECFLDEHRDPVFRLRFVKQFPKPLPLSAMKKDRAFEGFVLLRLPRLSVMPVPEHLAVEILQRVE
ncbi:MAG: EVE domain-containing protein [Chloroherpetonaceae bacterium]|nr:EVE domain-containing protein [Chloroherpetonaceae bacterium]MCS7211025.1 EVE domain-containing protein [Chloroherpetonaceae bacterium]MDW8019424.1 EVE domain-containing protein [Chloroherpetonaceae bacterium]MDW8466045.1 EVE domain-containing protein [Chloroherpetonaceae bacterium]